MSVAVLQVAKLQPIVFPQTTAISPDPLQLRAKNHDGLAERRGNTEALSIFQKDQLWKERFP
jgi:hypothetical protein